MNILPLANWSLDQRSGEDNQVTVTLHLNGDAPEYPVEASNSETIQLNAAANNSPSQIQHIFARDSGLITISASRSNQNSGNAPPLVWHSGDISADVSEQQLQFDPASLSPGSYLIEVETLTSGSNPQPISAALILTIVEQLPLLSAGLDRDGDGIDDATEGLGDDDGDGVPDFADANGVTNLLPMYQFNDAPAAGAWFVETEPGLHIALNVYGAGSDAYSTLLNPASAHRPGMTAINRD